MKNPRFIHLRVHTEYSLLQGAVHAKKLPEMAAKMNMPAVAVTDTNNMFCALEFSEGASKAGIQPIIGCQVDLGYTVIEQGKRQEDPAGIVLLAQSEAGYLNLMKLNSCLYLDQGNQVPQVTLDDLQKYNAGLICLTGGPDGPIGRLLRAGQRPAAEALMDRFAAIYPDRLYVELQRHPDGTGLPEAEALSERGFVEMAYAKGLPLVATNDVYFPKISLYEAHDALMCIADGAYVDQQEPRRRLTPQHFMKTPEEMITLFADLPEAIDNTVEISRRCAFKVYKRDPILPKFADDEIVELRRQANEGLQARLAVIPHAVSLEAYQARLDFELGIIEGMGFPGYFLIVADFIKYAKENKIPVGPGRGSGAGSLVAYALLITDLDPLRYSLLFERFLNPERVSMPDFDIDFCMDRREEVIRYVQDKYGRDKVGQIITFGALLSKAAVRDVGRVLQMPYGQVDRLSKMIPVEGVKPVSIEKALGRKPFGYVIDLRSNPGGLLDQAVEVSDVFLDRVEVVSQRGRDKRDIERYFAQPGDFANGLPIVVLVDSGSASAAEIVAGALQDHHRGLVLGERTFGKGSVQTLIPLDEKTALRLTTARYYTPSGRSVQEGGIEPDITLPQLSDPDYKARPRFREADLSRHLINEAKVDNSVLEADEKPDPRFKATPEELKAKGITDFQLHYAIETVSRLGRPKLAAAAPRKAVRR